MSESQQERTPLRDAVGELPPELIRAAVAEWRSRTKFGKVLYPIWFFENLLLLIGWVLFGGFLILAGKVIHPEPKDSESSRLSIPTPEVYKDE